MKMRVAGRLPAWPISIPRKADREALERGIERGIERGTFTSALQTRRRSKGGEEDAAA